MQQVLMKTSFKLSYCLTVLVSLNLLVTLTGCNDAVDAAKGKWAQLTKMFKDATVLDRMQGKLADAKKSRANLKGIADEFSVNAGVALKQIERLEEAKAETVASFSKLQETARNAGLPKFDLATAEDKAKVIEIGAKNFTGEEIYRALKDYKAQVEAANASIERERTRSDFYKERAGKIRSNMPQIDDNIAKMENDIADYKMYKELFEASKTIDSLGLSDDKMNTLLNTDSALAELRKEIDKLAVQGEMRDQENRNIELKDEVKRGSSFSITNDDLI